MRLHRGGAHLTKLSKRKLKGLHLQAKGMRFSLFLCLGSVFDKECLSQKVGLRLNYLLVITLNGTRLHRRFIYSSEEMREWIKSDPVQM
jgi:hypothetical protein